jgi:hypothetical protein
MSRRLTAVLVIGAAIGSAAFASGAGAQASPAALLQGTFLMSGKVTVAHNVRGERVGDVVTRNWTFTPQCPTAPCPTVQLVRQRATGSDMLTLRQTPSGSYAGTGSFYAALRCSGRVYPRGELIPFKITVRVTESTGTVASAISATYVNRARRNLTPCIGVLGHDSARYEGQLVTG